MVVLPVLEKVVVELPVVVTISGRDDLLMSSCGPLLPSVARIALVSVEMGCG